MPSEQSMEKAREWIYLNTQKTFDTPAIQVAIKSLATLLDQAIAEEREGEPLTFRRLQDEQRPWVKHNFPGREPYYPLLGVVEELGELAHAHLKALQGIRTGEDHTADAKDAVGDVVIFLADYCTGQGFDFQEITEETWTKVKQRDWKADPKTGQVTAIRAEVKP